ncbi:hypothetical protein Drorol1_Dr00026924 [Drosera rotundifolia]
MDQLVCVTDAKTGLGNSERSSGPGPLKYKRRRVSAVRDFPPGCGPNAIAIAPRVHPDSAGDVNGETNGQKGDDLPKVEVKDEMGSTVDWEADKKTPTLGIVGNGGLMKVENGVMNNSEHDSLLQDPNVRVQISSQDMEPIPPVGGSSRATPNESKQLEPAVGNGNGMEGLYGNIKVEDDDMEAVEDTKPVQVMKAVEENGTETFTLPYYTIPSNLIGKERKYPPRRKLSATRDFPPGCGPAIAGNFIGDGLQIDQQLDQHVSRGDKEAKNYEDILRSVVDDIRENFKDDDGDQHVKPKGDASTAIDGHVQGVSRLGRVASGETSVKPVQSHGKTGFIMDKPSEMKTGKIPSYTKGDGKMVSVDRLNKGKQVVIMDKSSKRKFLGVSGTIMPRQSEQIVYLDDLEGVVIVLGLTVTPSYPLKQQVRAVKSIPSSSMGNGNRLKTGHPEGNNTPKLIASKKENKKPNDLQRATRPCDYVITLPPSIASSSSDKDSRRKVRESLRLFQALVRKLAQEEESKRKPKGTAPTRVDQIASKILKDSGKYVNTGKAIIGPVPGVEVGDEFHYRAELMIIGIHHPPMAGIDSVKQGETPLATSIVASGRYDNEVESSDVLIYTGQGGVKIGDKEAEDQKLERGNLALKNSSEMKNYVRVIRGYRESKASEYADVKAKMVSTYTYDGLYIVERYWQEVAAHGKMVYKFELRRVPGQPELAWKEVKKSNKFKQQPGRCVDDISGGKEQFLISAVSIIDDEKPPAFTYITSMILPKWYRCVPPKGCDCVGGCSDSEKCSCAVKNGGEISFNCNGAIVNPKSLVYECGPCCRCPPTCHNRVVQHGIKFQLEIFKTESRGWGVRSLSSISSGSFICEYIGELIEDKEAEQRIGNDEYLFDIGQNYDDQGLHEGVSTLMPDSSATSTDVVQEGYTIDAAKYGNVARFINHSCNPNLYAQNILYDNDDKQFPHIGLFAMENIPPLQELTYHYNYTNDEVLDSDGNVKRKNCYCGSSGCSGRMY